MEEHDWERLQAENQGNLLGRYIQTMLEQIRGTEEPDGRKMLEKALEAGVRAMQGTDTPDGKEIQ